MGFLNLGLNLGASSRADFSITGTPPFLSAPSVGDTLDSLVTWGGPYSTTALIRAKSALEVGAVRDGPELASLPGGAVLGPELVTNGGFDDGSGWVIVSDGQISGGVANIKSDDGSYKNLRQLGVLQTGKTYILSYEVTRSDAGGLKLINAGYGQPVLDSTVGTHVFQFIADTTDLDIGRRIGVTDIDLDNIALREVTTLTNNAATVGNTYNQLLPDPEIATPPEAGKITGTRVYQSGVSTFENPQITADGVSFELTSTAAGFCAVGYHIDHLVTPNASVPMFITVRARFTSNTTARLVTWAGVATGGWITRVSASDVGIGNWFDLSFPVTVKDRGDLVLACESVDLNLAGIEFDYLDAQLLTASRNLLTGYTGVGTLPVTHVNGTAVTGSVQAGGVWIDTTTGVVYYDPANLPASGTVTFQLTGDTTTHDIKIAGSELCWPKYTETPATITGTVQTFWVRGAEDLVFAEVVGTVNAQPGDQIKAIESVSDGVSTRVFTSNTAHVPAITGVMDITFNVEADVGLDLTILINSNDQWLTDNTGELLTEAT